MSFIKLSPCLNFVIYIIFRTNDRLCLPLHLANFLLITRHLSLSFSLYKKKTMRSKTYYIITHPPPEALAGALFFAGAGELAFLAGDVGFLAGTGFLALLERLGGGAGFVLV